VSAVIGGALCFNREIQADFSEPRNKARTRGEILLWIKCLRLFLFAAGTGRERLLLPVSA
jgi:hypothetical protein